MYPIVCRGHFGTGSQPKSICMNEWDRWIKRERETGVTEETHADNLRYYTYLVELFNICMHPKSIIKIKRNRIVKFNVKMRLSLPPDRAIIRWFNCKAFAEFASVHLYMLFFFFVPCFSVSVSSTKCNFVRLLWRCRYAKYGSKRWIVTTCKHRRCRPPQSGKMLPSIRTIKDEIGDRDQSDSASFHMAILDDRLFRCLTYRERCKRIISLTVCIH